MRKFLQLLAVLVVFALMGFCTMIGGFYNHEILVEVKLEKVDEKTPEETEQLESQEGAAEAEENTVPPETVEPEPPAETKVIKVALGDKVLEVLHLTKVKQKLGVEGIRKAMIIAVMILGMFQGFMLTRLFKCTHRHGRHRHPDNVDYSQALEGYPIPRDPNRLKF